ncbi:hypothetical protein [Metapseudomonas resinovorans]|uniref:DUF3077 domain-containing protein n=1 Tax=Metapseudomonas resinovorans NBRC 106553 TaxID=1245471 RepID=S6ACI2_METRE|nr:hypothetical protein [Pseudomonas resinovorans]BAN46442.1 hypothetical protein PCA10_07100 [Pseudomonas resinovorans NBRC 106553]
MSDFRPLPQPCRDVLYFNAAAPAEDLFDTAEQRMVAALNLLQILEFSDSKDFVQHQATRLASALGVLLSDARVLYEAAQLRAQERP